MVDSSWKPTWSDELRRAASSSLSRLSETDYDGFIDILAFWEVFYVQLSTVNLQAFRLLNQADLLMSSCLKAFSNTRACDTRTGDKEFDEVFDRGIAKGKTIFKDVYLLSQLLNHYLNPHKRLCGDPEGTARNPTSAKELNHILLGKNTAIMSHMVQKETGTKASSEMPIHEMATLRGNTTNRFPVTDNHVTGSMKKFNIIKSVHDLPMASDTCADGICSRLRYLPLYNKVPFLSLGNFLIFYRINEGSSGKVHIGFHKLHRRTYALKIISKKQLNGDRTLFCRLKDEVNLATSITHPNIVRTFELLETKNSLVIAMEYCDGGDLIGLIKEHSPMHEDMARTIFRMVLNGVKYLHQNNICHRDLKPENVFLKRVQGKVTQSQNHEHATKIATEAREIHHCSTSILSRNSNSLVNDKASKDGAEGIFPEERLLKSSTCSTDVSRQCSKSYVPPECHTMPYVIKIGDFGAATRVTQPKGLIETVGTMSYAAPEVLGCGGTVGYCGKQADVWSLGIMLFAMLFGELPWHNEKVTLRQAVSNLVNQPISFPRNISVSARNLLHGMLHIDPTKRLTIKEAVDHPWLREPPFDSVLNIKKIRPTLSKPT